MNGIDRLAFGFHALSNREVNISIQYQQARIKILIAFEDEFRAYRQTLAAAIGIVRPDAEVVTVEAHEVRGVVERSGPDMVICSLPKDGDTNCVRAWIELSLDPTRPTKVRVDGEYSEIINPTLDALLVIIDEVEQLTRKGDL
jgi:hypothetical protein